jgi:hypothetical protein
MSSVAQQKAVSDVATTSPTVKIAGGKRLYEFTRHPRELAKVRGLKLQACLRFVLEALILYADREGFSWVQAETLAETTPRSTRRETYALPSVRRALRQLKALGWVDWTVVAAFGRYPSRGKDKKLVWGNGRREYHGGRVWRVNLERIRAVEHGTDSAGWIMLDPPGRIPRDPPSDRSLSSGESKSIVASPGARPAALPPERPADAGGRVAPPTPQSPSAKPASVKSVASETPPAAVAVLPSRSAPSSAPERERQGGKGEQERSQDRPLSLEEMPAAFAELDRAMRGGPTRTRIRV